MLRGLTRGTDLPIQGCMARKISRISLQGASSFGNTSKRVVGEGYVASPGIDQTFGVPGCSLIMLGRPS
jgi:hypothetical protein